jgi:Tol biopolymer transport system component
MPADPPTNPPPGAPRAIAGNRPRADDWPLARALRHALGVTLSTLLAAFTLGVPAAQAEPATYMGSSADGGKVFFETTEKLVPGDTDTRMDVYQRAFDAEPGIETYVTREVSTGPTGGNDAYPAQYDGASEDGSRVFFSTKESLVSEDTDHSTDIYMRDLTTGTTTLVSQGDSSCAASGCGNGAADSNFVPGGVVPDGTKVFFVTDEQLSTEDTDNAVDIYMRDLTTGETKLVSQGNGSSPAVFQGVSADGSEAVFTTAEQLGAGDTDNQPDIYVRDLNGGTTSLASTAGICLAPENNSDECNPIYRGISSSGSRIFFETQEQLSPQDEDTTQDVYEWSGGTTTLVSTGAEGEGGKGAFDATYQGASSDGGAVFFETSEKLSSADGDEQSDIYDRSSGTTTLVSTGPKGGNDPFPSSFDSVSPDVSAVVFSTAEQLTGADTDSFVDVYTRDLVTKTTTLDSRGTASCPSICGNGPFDANFAAVSSDGSHVLFQTAEPLVPQDTDSSLDIYESVGGTTTLVSAGGNGPFTSSLTGVSSDGSHVFFITEERLTVDDLDTEIDVYDHSGSETLLVSVGNSVQLGPATPALAGTNPLSPNASTEPAILGEAEPNTSIKIYATPDCSGVPVAVGTSAQLEGAGIQVTVAPSSTTTFHATATDLNGDTSGCSIGPVSYQQMPGAGGGGEGGGGGGGGAGGGTTEGSQSGSGGGTQAGGGHRVAPQTRITFAPGAKTRARRPEIRFADATGQDETAFVCKVDRHGWHGCSSPQRLKRLRPGRHVFEVKGVNSGIWETNPVARRFKVVSR